MQELAVVKIEIGAEKEKSNATVKNLEKAEADLSEKSEKINLLSKELQGANQVRKVFLVHDTLINTRILCQKT